ncbi:MAG TPA: ThiF family adenylyltransferase [Opitutaceae bacterium]|nr:ThiF family adenylyltransferase [Opitutaceae bacterium]
MNSSAKKENSRSLAEMMGIREDEAAALLEASVAVTFADDDRVAKDIATHTAALLSRTLSDVRLNDAQMRNVAVELVVGAIEPRYESPKIWLSVASGRATITKSRLSSDASNLHPIARLIAACYACAAAIDTLIGERLPYPTPETYVVDMCELLGEDAPLLDKECDFSEAHLAGAGAIGNGFVLGLAQLPIHGKLYVVDDDNVSEGNLQRCALFSQSDVGLKKAEVLAAAAARTGSRVVYVPRTVRLQQLAERKEGPWLKRLVVAVDSPRARRHLQNEMPGEVFDASTTGAAEIVFHYHRQPADAACLGCVYPSNPDEHAHERHVAESLGVSIEDVSEIKISQAAATKILAKYPDLERESVVGAPYDTLFKALCSSEKLFTAEGRDVLTPFAFVSALAGVLLALEFFRRTHRGHSGLPNYWRISPWNNFMARNRRTLPRNPDCEFCGVPVLRELIQQMWANRV